MAPENNTDASQGVTPASNIPPTPTPPAGIAPHETAPAPTAPQPTLPVSPVVMDSPVVPAQPTPAKPSFFKKILSRKKMIGIGIILFLLVGALPAAYFMGKSHERIIIQAPAPQPINLPPQAVVVANCVAGRGKPYILPKDIPFGPVYDVVNNQVISVEFNFKASDLFVNGNKLSDTLIPFFKGNYKTEYFVITPGTLQPGQSQADTPVNVAIFVVSKDDASKITCQTPAS